MLHILIKLELYSTKLKYSPVLTHVHIFILFEIGLIFVPITSILRNINILPHYLYILFICMYFLFILFGLAHKHSWHSPQMFNRSTIPSRLPSRWDIRPIVPCTYIYLFNIYLFRSRRITGDIRHLMILLNISVSFHNIWTFVQMLFHSTVDLFQISHYYFIDITFRSKLMLHS